MDNDKDKVDKFIPSSQPLIPLEVGNFWEYHQWRISPDFADTVREEVLSSHDIVANGVKVLAFGLQRFRKNQGPDLENVVWLYANGKLQSSDSGYYLVGGLKHGELSAEKYNLELNYKYPGETGDNWQISGLSYNYQTGEFSPQQTENVKLLGINATFETDYGRFEGCYVYGHYSLGLADINYYNWYIKPGIGIVGGELRWPPELDEGEVFGQWTLIDYKLN